GVVLRAARRGRQLAAGHHHDAPAGRLDVLALLLVSGDDLVEAGGAGGELVGAGAADDRAAGGARRAAATRDQRPGGLVVEAHATLRRVHRLRNAEPVRPQVLAEAHGRLPIDGVLTAVGAE